MKTLVTLVSVAVLTPLAALALAEAAPMRASPAVAAIANGIIDEDNQFPNVCTIMFINPPAHNPDLPVPFHFVSGVLVAPNVVLTAGHSTASILRRIAAGDSALEDLRVSFAVDAFDPGTWLEIDGLITHPDFNPFLAGTPTPDLGAIILSQPVLDIEPATLPHQGMLHELTVAGQLRPGPSGTTLDLTGYGRLEPAVPSDGLRRFTPARFIAATLPWVILDNSSRTCCTNDSGSAAFYTDAQGNRTLVGLAASSTDLQYWMTRLDTPQMLDFIEEVLDDSSRRAPPATHPFAGNYVWWDLPGPYYAGWKAVIMIDARGTITGFAWNPWDPWDNWCELDGSVTRRGRLTLRQCPRMSGSAELDASGNMIITSSIGVFTWHRF